LGAFGILLDPHNAKWAGLQTPAHLFAACYRDCLDARYRQRPLLTKVIPASSTREFEPRPLLAALRRRPLLASRFLPGKHGEKYEVDFGQPLSIWHRVRRVYFASGTSRTMTLRFASSSSASTSASVKNSSVWPWQLLHSWFCGVTRWILCTAAYFQVGT
jgi:hypothetical protein